MLPHPHIHAPHLGTPAFLAHIVETTTSNIASTLSFLVSAFTHSCTTLGYVCHAISIVSMQEIAHSLGFVLLELVVWCVRYEKRSRQWWIWSRCIARFVINLFKARFMINLFRQFSLVWRVYTCSLALWAVNAEFVTRILQENQLHSNNGSTPPPCKPPYDKFTMAHAQRVTSYL